MINNILSDHKLIFQSDMVDSSQSTRGRPFGGKCWVIRNDVNLVSYELFSDIISMIKICDGNGKFIYLFGAWIPFDDGSRERVSELVSAFSLIESYISNYIDPNNDHVILMGDLNCDPSRCNRFDSIYLHFFNENKFIDYFDFFLLE